MVVPNNNKIYINQLARFNTELIYIHISPNRIRSFLRRFFAHQSTRHKHTRSRISSTFPAPHTVPHKSVCARNYRVPKCRKTVHYVYRTYIYEFIALPTALLSRICAQSIFLPAIAINTQPNGSDTIRSMRCRPSYLLENSLPFILQVLVCNVQCTRWVWLRIPKKNFKNPNVC